jgi:hypothetical protein
MDLLSSSLSAIARSTGSNRVALKMETVYFSKRWYLLTGLHGITTQKNNVGMFPAVRTSNITILKFWYVLHALAWTKNKLRAFPCLSVCRSFTTGTCNLLDRGSLLNNNGIRGYCWNKLMRNNGLGSHWCNNDLHDSERITPLECQCTPKSSLHFSNLLVNSKIQLIIISTFIIIVTN